MATQDRFAPDSPFRYVGGDPCLDFVNTADWTPRGLERDRFTSYERVVEWAEAARVLGAAEATRLRAGAARAPHEADATLRAVYQARELLRDVFVGTLSGSPGAADLERFNAMFSATASHARLVAASGGLVKGWSGFGDVLESVLWPVVWSAADLVASSDAARLRMCAGRDCGWLYVDRSRNRLRRWCEMSVCGTAEKNRRRARR